MIKNTTDARTLRTQALLKSSMLSELESKRLHEITVASLCRSSHINRVTFYDHYKDVFDLADSIENDLILELEKTFRKLSLEEASTHSVSDAMFEFLDAHRGVMLLLLKGETGTSLRSKFSAAVFPFFEAQLRYRYEIPRFVTREDLMNIMHYIASGYDYFFTQYLEDPSLDYQAISTLCTELSNQVFLSWKQKLLS